MARTNHSHANNQAPSPASSAVMASPSDALRADFTGNFSQTVSHQSSKIVAISAKLSWKIEQFERLTRLYKNNKSLVSEKFFSAAAPNVVWELHVYPNGKREEDIGHVSFFLRQIGLEQTTESLLADFQIYVTDQSGTILSICRDAKEFTNQQGRGKFQVARDRLMSLIQPDGTLHLCCDVEYLPLKSATQQERKIWDLTAEKAISLRDTIASLYTDAIHTDVEILVNGQLFRAHRAILARASEVFNSMFGKGMREAEEGTIKITDSTPSAVRGMLEYIYMGTIERTLFEKNARDILTIAEKYMVLPLKEECERYMSESLSIKNFTTLVAFADTYSCEILMEECRKFLVLNYDQITNSKEWADLKRRQLNVVNELLEKSLQDRIQSNTTRQITHSKADPPTLVDLGEPLPKRARRVTTRSSGLQP